MKDVITCLTGSAHRADIRDEEEKTGRTMSLEFIHQKASKKACSCEIMNSQDSCCLGSISQAIKKIKKESL